MNKTTELARFTFGVAGLDAATDFRGEMTDLGRYSRNLIPNGLREMRPFRGMSPVGDAGEHLFQVKDTWGHFRDVGSGFTGSFFSVLADMLIYCGAGQVGLGGSDLPGIVASSVLKMLLKWNGSYTATESGPYAAGLPEPDAPQVGLISDASIYGTPNLTGTVSIKYARLRKTTGGRSHASATSTVLSPRNQAMWVEVPTLTSGQTHHIFFGTDTKLGGIGLHFRISRANPFTNDEYVEDDVQRTVTGITLVAPDILQTATPKFTAGDIGKRVNALTGFTVPLPTTVAEVISTTQIRLSNNHTVTSGSCSCELIAYAGGIDRTVVLNWTPSDLVEEIAWDLDFPPPAVSHAFMIENRLYAVGYADATGQADATRDNPDGSASAANPGTVLIPSLPNQLESFDYRYPIFLPEPVIDVLSDGMDSYKFIGGRNGIYAVQGINTDTAAPATVSVLLRGEGIAAPHNWCARQQAIYLFTAKSQPTRIIQGGVVDVSFGAKVKPITQDWDPAKVVVAPHPVGAGVIYAHQREMLVFDEATNRWSSVIRLDDYVEDTVGNNRVWAGVATQSYTVLACSNGYAYEFDQFASACWPFVAGSSAFVEGPGAQQQKIVQFIRAAARVDETSIGQVGWILIHADTQPINLVGSLKTDAILSPDIDYQPEFLGNYVICEDWTTGSTKVNVPGRIRGVDGVNYLIGSPTRNLADSVPVSFVAASGLTTIWMAKFIFPFTFTRQGTIEILSDELYLPIGNSYAVSIIIPSAMHERVQPLHVALDGFLNNEAGWTNKNAVFGVMPS